MQGQQIKYANVSLPNSTSTPIIAYKPEVRDTPFIDYPSDWELVVTRMQCSLELVPLFLPVIPDPLFPLKTDMSITLKYGGSYFQQFINVTPEEAKDGVFSYGNYLQQLNLASAAAMVAAIAAFPILAGTVAPKFYLNPSTSLISMYVQDSYLDSNVNRVQVGFNDELQQLLDFPSDDIFPADLNGFNHLLSVNNDAILLPAAPRTGVPLALSAIAGNLLQVSQEFSSLDEWDDVRSIIFVTNKLPIVPQLLPNTYPGQTLNNEVARGGQTVLMDFELVKGNPFEPRHIAQYIPQSEFKVIEMVGTSPINIIDIQAFYVTYRNERFELYLNPNTIMTMQIMFRPRFKLVRDPFLYSLFELLLEEFKAVRLQLESKNNPKQEQFDSRQKSLR